MERERERERERAQGLSTHKFIHILWTFESLCTELYLAWESKLKIKRFLACGMMNLKGELEPTMQE
jgi:hypothetical protein